MRLSEAIMLGYSQITFRPHNWLMRMNKDRLCGCLIGAGLVGAGFELQSDGIEDISLPIADLFPWIRKMTVQYPCATPCAVDLHDGQYGISHKSPNSLLFVFPRILYEHVPFSLKHIGDWTLEQAVDWIRSIEPEENEEKTTPVIIESGNKQDTQLPKDLCTRT